jgi:hypothetical protein
MELRGPTGQLIARSTTTAGVYEFPSTLPLVPGTTYYVSPVVDRTQSADRMQQSFPLPPGGMVANFNIRGVNATVTVQNNPPGALVLLTTFTYTNPNPPVINPSSKITDFYSATTDTAGRAVVRVRGGFNYHMTCWIPQVSGGRVTYVRRPLATAAPPAIPVPGNPLDPRENAPPTGVSFSCPP